MPEKPTNTEILREILQQKLFYSSPIFNAKIKEGGRGASRALFIVSASVSKRAVDRNRLKRRAREIVRERLRGRSGISLAVFFKKDAEKLSFGELKEDLLRFLTKLK